MIFKREVVSGKNKHDMFCAELGRHGCFLLSHKRAVQLPPPPPFNLSFISKVRCCSMCMQNETFYVSIIAPNATIVVYGIFLGDMHPML